MKNPIEFMEDKPRVGVIGSGYVGLVTGSCFAKVGFNVTLGDIIQEKVDMINAARPPIFEEGLEELLKEIVADGRMRATMDIPGLVRSSDIIFIAVGTPSREDGSIDLKYIEAVARDIGNALKDVSEYKVIVDKSTVVPGTTEHVIGRIIEEVSGKKVGTDFGLGMNPEFLKEGVAIEDFMKPDRVVIGAINDRSYEMIAKLYSYVNSEKIMRTSIAEAELIKYASNSFLALKISFINEIANYADRVGGIDVGVIAKGMGMDARISPRFLQAGIGFGGSCFPKDVKALIADAREREYDFRTLEAAIEVNKKQPFRMIEEAEKRFSLEKARVAVLGLAFKPGTDDMREAVSIPIIHVLLKRGSTVIATDPIAIENAQKVLPEDVHFVDDAKEALRDADIALLVTEWPQYRSLTADDYVALMTKKHKPIIIDGRRVHDPPTMLSDERLEYKCIGYAKDK